MTRQNHNPNLSIRVCLLLIGMLLVNTLAVRATNHFVATNGGHDTAGGYTNWVGAATNIQAAVDASIAGDTVWVSNGVYITSTPVRTPQSLHAATNVSCVHLAKNITLKSVNGPSVTVIDGNYNVITAGCVHVESGATLDGFTVRNGYTPGNPLGSGIDITRGVLDDNTLGGIATNCIAHNNNGGWGGGILVRAATGIVANCTVYSNAGTSRSGGIGVDSASGTKIENCTVFDNTTSGDFGAGGIGCYESSSLTVRNCLVYRNSTVNFGGGMYVNNSANTYVVNIDNCTIVSNYAAKIGGGLFISNSPAANVCNSIIYYNACSSNADVFTLKPTLTNNCMSDTNALTGGLGNITNEPSFVDTNSANYRLNTNSPCRNTGIKRGWMDGAVDLVGNPRSRYGMVDMGAYEYVFVGVNRYVSLNGGHDTAGGYTNWAGAATGIQYAISVCIGGDVVWVTNGTYDVGEVMTNASWDATGTTNRVAITTEYVTVRSANSNPANTIIKGGGTYNTADAIRSVYMTNNTTLIGFTLTNGATKTTGLGGNVLAQSTNTVISNCVMVGGKAGYNGGGAYGGTLYNCTISNNLGAANAGGVQQSTLYNCSIVNNSGQSGGGGVRNSTLYNCLVKDNWTWNAVGRGGGALDSTLYNCVIVSNSAAYGGGINGGAIYNCTLISNTATTSGGGVTNAGVYNSIVYFNTAPNGSNWISLTWATNSCIAPDPGGAGNITGDPMFVNKGAGNYRLAANSPCINTGTNYSWMLDPVDTRSKDMDGLARVRYGTVDMGAYERIFDATIYRLFR